MPFCNGQEGRADESAHPLVQVARVVRSPDFVEIEWEHPRCVGSVDEDRNLGLERTDDAFDGEDEGRREVR
jgi:hypothetical protein